MTWGIICLKDDFSSHGRKMIIPRVHQTYHTNKKFLWEWVWETVLQHLTGTIWHGLFIGNCLFHQTFPNRLYVNIQSLSNTDSTHAISSKDCSLKTKCVMFSRDILQVFYFGICICARIKRRWLTLVFLSLSAGVSVQTDLSPDLSSALLLNVRGPRPKLLSSGGSSVIQDSLLTAFDPSFKKETKLEAATFS